MKKQHPAAHKKQKEKQQKERKDRLLRDTKHQKIQNTAQSTVLSTSDASDLMTNTEGKKNGKKQGLSSTERLNLMLLQGGIISIISIMINFSVKYFGTCLSCFFNFNLSYEQWTTVLGIVTVAAINVITYHHYKKRMLTKASRNVLSLANAFALAVNVALSSIYLVFNDNTRLVVAKIVSQINVSIYSFSGKLFIDLATIVKHIPMLNMGHIIYVFGLIVFSMLKKSFNK